MSPPSSLRSFYSHPFFSYLLLTGFIVGWWMLAFQTTAKAPLFIHDVSQTLGLKTSDLLNGLSPFQRDVLKQALAGNFNLMLEFIDKWEEDALLLEEQGIKGIQHLSKERYYQAHLLGHLLNFTPSDSLQQLNWRINLERIADDDGRLFKIENTYRRFIPQTHLSAIFLLAIAPHSEIVGLPKGLRKEKSLYSSDSLALIPHDIDQLTSEKLFLKKSDLAFVAPYSHPSSLEMLQNQKIQLYTIRHIDTVEQIQEALLKIGHATNHILEAQLLAIFMEASFLSLDNRLLSLRKSKYSMRSLLFLSHRQHYVRPTTKCLCGQLMARALKLSTPHLKSVPENQRYWSIPIEQESIVQANPDCMIISSTSPPSQVKDATWRETDAGQREQVFYLDESIQESPTQYIVLAYFDVCQALSHFYIR